MTKKACGLKRGEYWRLIRLITKWDNVTKLICIFNTGYDFGGWRGEGGVEGFFRILGYVGAWF